MTAGRAAPARPTFPLLLLTFLLMGSLPPLLWATLLALAFIPPFAIPPVGVMIFITASTVGLWRGSTYAWLCSMIVLLFGFVASIVFLGSSWRQGLQDPNTQLAAGAVAYYATGIGTLFWVGPRWVTWSNSLISAGARAAFRNARRRP